MRVSIFTVKRVRRINRIMYTSGLEKIKACVTYKETVFQNLENMYRDALYVYVRCKFYIPFGWEDKIIFLFS